MWSIDDALAEFLAAPACRPRGLDGSYMVDAHTGGWTNRDIIVATLGCAGIEVRDPATFDTVSGAYGAPARTFREAFRLCAASYSAWGQRDWLDFDILTLRGCCTSFRSLQMPVWVEEARAALELRAYIAAHDAAAVGAGDEDPPF